MGRLSKIKRLWNEHLASRAAEEAAVVVDPRWATEEYILAESEAHAARAAAFARWKREGWGTFTKPDRTRVRYVDSVAACCFCRYGARVWLTPSFNNRGDFDEFYRRISWGRTLHAEEAWWEEAERRAANRK